MTDYERDRAKAYEEFRNEVREFLKTQSQEELSYILGRYCGRNNQILSDKKFGYIMPEDLVKEALEERMFEDAFL